MAEDNVRPAEESGAPDVERKLDKSSGCRLRDQRALKVKDRPEEIRLPTPPPDPQCPRLVRDREVTSRVAGRSVDEEEEEEDLAAYLGELGASPFEGHSFDYDTPNSATSAMGGAAGTCTEEAFEHLDRLCALTEQVLELRSRSSKYFRRVRELERVKTLRNADRRLEITLANDEDVLGDFPDEDTGFAESLLDAMLSNCRQDPPTQRRNERANVRSPSSRQRSRSLALAEQTLTGVSSVVDRCDVDKRITGRNPGHNGGPKISKWTRVKAAFKWERACANDLAEIAESNAMTPSTPTTRYLRIPDVTTGSWSGSALSPCTSELSSPSTPIGRVSPASSSNEEVFDDSRRNIVNYPDRQTSQVKDDRKKDDPDRCGRSFDRDTPVTENADSIELPNETNRGKPLIRIISDADATMRVAIGGGKDPEILPKRPTPTLTITIPSNEEEVRSLSSPESMSPLPSSAQDSGGSSPQRPKMRQDISSPREFKRQYSTIEEAVTPAPKIQRQDSKWNKVRRAFLTNATFSVPPSPVRVTATQSFASDDTRRARSCSESVEDLGKTVAGTNHCRSEALRDYQALREKFGAEFHRKLVEWERLKGSTPRVLAARNSRDGLPLSEERLAPEFRKKLQDWKRAKKGRRTGTTSIEQQRVSRRRLTDWQLWRSSSKPESRCYGKNQNSIGSHDSCASIGSAGSFSNDGKQHLCEDFVKRMEAWRRMSEAACRSNERPKPPANRAASDIIDETEFLALEKLLLLFGQRARKERRESDAKQLNDCFDGDARFTAASRGVNCGNEVLIRTSVGSYRFEGISREFTRKLYDWEKYRGISPRSSTFRLLGPGYTPFAQDSEEATLAERPSTTGKNRALHWGLKRSKSDGSVFDGGLRDESYALRRSTSLHSLISTDKLEDDNRIDTLPPSKNPQSIKDPSEDTAVEDSEPEAMIVDIEDVIEETASPLERVQPHQTPVYSVAASETTSIAVPLGTVTSSHEPSPVFLVGAEDENDCGRWNGRTWIKPETRSSENSPSPECFSASEDWREKMKSLDEDKLRWEPWRKERDKEDEASIGWTEDTRRSISDSDSMKFDQPIGWNRDAWDEPGEITQRYAGEANRDSTELESSLTPTFESGTSKDDTKKQDYLEGTDAAQPAKPAQSTKNFGSLPMTWHAEKLMDSSCTRNMMKETRKIEDPTDESNNGRKSDIVDHDEDDEDGGKSGRATLDTDSHTYNLAKTLSSSSNCLDSGENSLNLSNLSLDDNKNTSECGADTENETLARYEKCDSSELQTDIDRHYEILTFKTDTCGDTVDDRFLYEPINCHEPRNSFYDDGNNHAKGNLSLSNLSGTENPSLSETMTNLLIDTTIRTIPVTVPRDSDARSPERILINEQTLNRIIVPTACAENGTRSSEKLRHHFANVADCSDEAAITGDRQRECDHAPTETSGDRQVACVKKDGFSSKNVFVKTKRMIFGPFRRSEDRPSMRKESDDSVDGRLVRRSKSKSKSRSASPKLHRQDALLRVSLSLPWPLRSTSRESEVMSEIESRRSSAGKAEDAVKVSGNKSPCSASINDERKNVDSKRRPNDQLVNAELSSIELNQSKIRHSDTNSMSASTSTWCAIGATTFPRLSEQSNRAITTSIERDVKARQIQNDEVERGRARDEGEQHEDMYSRVRDEEEEGDQRQDHAWQQDDNRSTSDAVPSDLMHKLRILSDAAAKREGRAMIAEVDRTVISSLESRSSRIRRAKESFLSRHGGPFCTSMTDSTAAANREKGTRDDPWRRASMSQALTTVAASRLNELAASNTRYEEAESAGIRSKTAETTSQNEIAGSSSEDKTDTSQEDRVIDVGLRAELVKSASAGMINVDPDTFGRLVAVDRGCESLPRTIAKRRDSPGPLAKIVGKLKLSRLIRARNVDGGNMSTISTLCRQSLLIDMQARSNNRSRNRESENDSVEVTKDKGENKDDCPIESSKTVHE